MTDCTCWGWDGTKWTNPTGGNSGKGSDPGKHAEQQAYSAQKAYAVYLFEQSTFPCDDKPVGSCHKTFLKASTGGNVSFIFSVAKNAGMYPVPAGTSHPVAAPAAPAPNASKQVWADYKTQKQDWENNPFVVQSTATKAASGTLYYHNGQAYFGARPVGFPAAG